jgi:nucleotide-binding universal stress UspA family protein
MAAASQNCDSLMTVVDAAKTMPIRPWWTGLWTLASPERRRERTSMTNPHRRVIVGVDGSAASIQALRWATDYAAAVGAVVEAVIAWDIPSTLGFGPTVLAGEDLAANAQKTLTGAIAVTAGDTSHVKPVVARGHPASVLLEHAREADLLVVGSHGRGAFGEALLGSVSHHCVRHATCPVVVVGAQPKHADAGHS